MTRGGQTVRDKTHIPIFRLSPLSVSLLFWVIELFHRSRYPSHCCSPPHVFRSRPYSSWSVPVSPSSTRHRWATDLLYACMKGLFRLSYTYRVHRLGLTDPPYGSFRPVSTYDLSPSRYQWRHPEGSGLSVPPGDEGSCLVDSSTTVSPPLSSSQPEHTGATDGRRAKGINCPQTSLKSLLILQERRFLQSSRSRRKDVLVGGESVF